MHCMPFHKSRFYSDRMRSVAISVIVCVCLIVSFGPCKFSFYMVVCRSPSVSGLF